MGTAVIGIKNNATNMLCACMHPENGARFADRLFNLAVELAWLRNLTHS